DDTQRHLHGAHHGALPIPGTTADLHPSRGWLRTLLGTSVVDTVRERMRRALTDALPVKIDWTHPLARDLDLDLGGEGRPKHRRQPVTDPASDDSRTTG